MQANYTFLHTHTQGTHQQWGGSLLNLLVTVQEISRSCGSTKQISNKVLAPLNDPGKKLVFRAENQFPLNRLFSPFPYFHSCTISTLAYSDHFKIYPLPSLFPPIRPLFLGCGWRHGPLARCLGHWGSGHSGAELANSALLGLNRQIQTEACWISWHAWRGWTD